MAETRGHEAPSLEERLACAESVIHVLLAAVDQLSHEHIFDDMSPEARLVLERWASLHRGGPE